MLTAEPNFAQTINDCQSALKQDGLQAYISSQCEGEDSCTLSFFDDNGNLNSDLFHNVNEVPAACYTGNSMIFVTAGCAIPDNELQTRQVQGLVIGCIFISVALFTLVYLDYIRQIAKNNFVEWDVKTVTSGDYSVEFDISKEFYDKFMEVHGHEKEVGQPMIVHFRKWITEGIENRLSQMPDLGFEDEPVTEIKVAVTQFAFNNAELIELLKQRGAAITADNFDLMRELDKKINDLKNEKLAQFTTPVSCFMTFENEEGAQRAKKFEEATLEEENAQLKHLRIWFETDDEELKEKYHIELQSASEPSDIIWENRHFTPTQRRKKEIVVVLTIGFALLLSFVVVFASRQYSNEMAAVYPIVDCAPYYSNYGTTLEGFAIAEYTSQQLKEDAGEKAQYTPVLSCFCYEQQGAGASPDATYPVGVENGSPVC